MFGMSVAHRRRVRYTVSASENDHSMIDAAQSAEPGYDYTKRAGAAGGVVVCILADGVIIGTDAGVQTPSFRTGAGWGPGWMGIVKVLAGNSARVQGRGGNGGRGQNSFDSGGGGGGGCGTTGGVGGDGGFGTDGGPGTSEAGGVGGFGHGAAGSSRDALDGGPGWACFDVADEDFELWLQPEATATLEAWAGGGGGGGGSGQTGPYDGGNGGSAGQTGQDGDEGSAGAGVGGVPGYLLWSFSDGTLHEDTSQGTIDSRGQ